MQCPKCNGIMGRYAYSESISLMRCKSCQGMLLESGMLEKIRAVVRADEYFDIGHPKVGRAFDRVQEYACPACSAPMRATAASRQGHIQIEVCSECSAVFLDAGELIDLSHDTFLERVWDAISGTLGMR